MIFQQNKKCTGGCSLVTRPRDAELSNPSNIKLDLMVPLANPFINIQLVMVMSDAWKVEKVYF